MMATLKMNTNRVGQITPDGFAVTYDGKPGPFPGRVVEVANKAELIAARAAYLADALAVVVGPFCASASVIAGRSPPGAKAAINADFYQKGGF